MKRGVFPEACGSVDALDFHASFTTAYQPQWHTPLALDTSYADAGELPNCSEV